MKNASFLKRAGAHIFDLLFVLIIVFGVSKLFSFPNDISGCLFWFGLLSYDTIMISKYGGRTLGKKFSNIQVVMESGKEITVWQAFKRAAVKWLISGLILGLGFLMYFSGEKSQALHDRMIGSLVIETV